MIGDKKSAANWLRQTPMPEFANNHFLQSQWRNIARAQILLGDFEPTPSVSGTPPLGDQNNQQYWCPGGAAGGVVTLGHDVDHPRFTHRFDPHFRVAAETLGATRWQSFRKVVLPELSPALLAGVALSFTRSLGEFGAVIFIAGNIAWKTEVTSLMIFVRLQEFDYPAASAIASVILAASLLLLFSINTLQSRFGRRVVGH
jgi:hypothetical protein